MAFGDIDVGEHIVPSAWDADDASITDATSALNAGTDNWKVTKSGQQLRVQENDATPANITALSVRIVASGSHNPSNTAMLAYTDDNSVTVVAKIIVDTSGGAATYDFVADSAFLDELGAVTGGGIAVRIANDNDGSGELTLTTCQIEFTTSGAAANPKGPLGMPLDGPFGGPI